MVPPRKRGEERVWSRWRKNNTCIMNGLLGVDNRETFDLTVSYTVPCIVAVLSAVSLFLLSILPCGSSYNNDSPGYPSTC